MKFHREGRERKSLIELALLLNPKALKATRKNCSHCHSKSMLIMREVKWDEVWKMIIGSLQISPSIPP